jgi:Tn3 transposase DDE domain
MRIAHRVTTCSSDTGKSPYCSRTKRTKLASTNSARRYPMPTARLNARNCAASRARTAAGTFLLIAAPVARPRAHDLSRFLCFGKEGALRGREFGDQIHTFSCLSVLHNAVVAWNTLHIGPIVGQLRAEGHVIDDDILGLTTPLFRKHLNPFGKYHFDLEGMRQTEGYPEQDIA